MDSDLVTLQQLLGGGPAPPRTPAAAAAAAGRHHLGAPQTSLADPAPAQLSSSLVSQLSTLDALFGRWHAGEFFCVLPNASALGLPTPTFTSLFSTLANPSGLSLVPPSPLPHSRGRCPAACPRPRVS